MLLPPPEPLLELLELPALAPDPGPEPAPGEPALSPLVPPLWPWVLLAAAAPVRFDFFFDLEGVEEEALLSAEPAADASFAAEPAADASFAAVCIEDEEPGAVPLMLDVLPLFEDLLDLDDLLESLLLDVSLGIELVPDELVPDELVPDELGLLVPVPVVPAVPDWELFRLDEPLPMLELLPLVPELDVP
ncbi:MAG TPA: hypothetical protein VFE23_19140 [Usitatibacter sp.]|nr:hypothetical protein [Usitatibacter sp.]